MACPCLIATHVVDHRVLQVTGSQIEAAITKTKAILIGYPNNPTGAIPGAWQDAGDRCPGAAKHDLLVISDEIYDRLTYAFWHTTFSAACRGCATARSSSGGSGRTMP